MTGARSPESFFETALAILQSEGFTKLTAVYICERLGVTRGSFYHHFASFDDFVERLLAYWEEHYTKSASESVEQVGDESAQRALQLFLADNLPHGAEAAIRAWSLVDDRVAVVQGRVDNYRVSSTAGYLGRHGMIAAEAEIYADISVSCLVGLQMIGRPADPARVRRAMAEIHAQIERRREQAGRRR